MKAFDSVNDILDFAIKHEQEAVDFYLQLAAQMKNTSMKTTFEDFAREEINHKAKLQKIKDEGVFTLPKENILDLKIADYITNVYPSGDMEYRDALVLAMKKEKAAFKLYTNLALRTENETLKNIFLGLAQEESKHKLSFEIEYDEFVMREN
ncbi:MAG: ferritin family protein [Bacteroidales bacterium]|nr:ferritin family protein [Bacteroidales bacterium]